MILYSYTVLCTVYLLRLRGHLLKPGDLFYMRARAGVLTVDRGLGTSDVHAVLHHVETGEELMRLYSARLVKIAGGGVLLAGDEMHFRGAKSKGDPSRQTWWCLPNGRTMPRPEVERADKQEMTDARRV